MADRSPIEWTETTWNPVTGCDHVSEGCDHCYAETLARRLKAMGNPRYVNEFAVTMHEDLIERPKSWKRPRVVFVNSMSDLFHPKVTSDFIRRVFAVMEATPEHTYQVLTKRPKRAVRMAATLPWPDNVWLGVSIESQRHAWRAEELKRVPARTRFLSCEPLLGPLQLNLGDIHWVIVGGESGHGFRPMDAAWARQIRDSCDAAGVPFFFKQWGGRIPKAGGRLLDGAEHNGMPQASGAKERDDGVAVAVRGR